MKNIFLVIYFLLFALFLSAQNDSVPTVQEAIYDRPFIYLGKTTTAVGGYVEGNTNYFSEDGVSDGFSMALRRFNIFIYSGIHDKIKFLSEVEFEHGTEEIALETALLDFEFNPALIFRAGILLPQIGMVNANHDSPKWEFVERPLSSTELIPSTLSEVGFGLLGKFYHGNYIFSYDAYVVNGLQENIILNEQGRTHLASGKSPEMFEEDNNGVPMLNGKISYAKRNAWDFGLSYYGGVYNRFRIEGVEVDERRNLAVYALDFSIEVKKLKLMGEFVRVNVEVPDDVDEIYGSSQHGGFLEAGYTILKKKLLGFDDAKLSVHTRFEMIDYNLGTFDFSGADIGDEITGLAFGVSFRPAAGTVLRFNYRYNWITDNLNNPPAHLGGIQFGVASYF